MTILREAQDSLDWDRLLMQTERRRLILPMRSALGYLCSLLGAPVPSAVLEHLDKLPFTRMEQFEYDHKTRPHPYGLLGHLPVLWCKYCRLAGSISLPRKLWGFLRFLQRIFGAESLWQLPRFLVLMGIRRIRRAIGLHLSH